MFFWRLSEVVWALFSTLNAPSFVVFSARKVGIWPPKTRNVGANFSLLRRPFRPFSCPKKWFLEHFESCFGVFQKLFGYCFWHIKGNFGFYFRLEMLISDLQNQMFGQILSSESVNLLIFERKNPLSWLFQIYFQYVSKFYALNSWYQEKIL